jgi:hypothetical protein
MTLAVTTCPALLLADEIVEFSRTGKIVPAGTAMLPLPALVWSDVAAETGVRQTAHKTTPASIRVALANLSHVQNNVMVESQKSWHRADRIDGMTRIEFQ